MPDQSVSANRAAYLKDYQYRWYRDVVRPRRQKWFEENGPCVDCGSRSSLELDHSDPATKVHHAIWSWSEERRLRELAKCVVRCKVCHNKKSVRESKARGFYGANKKHVVDGKVWCRGHQQYLPVEAFNKDRHAASGCYAVCKECRRKLPSRAQ